MVRARETTTPRFGRPFHPVHLLLTLLCLLLGGTAAADPPPFVAHYTLTRNGLHLGDSRLQLSREAGGGWRYASRVQPVGLLSLFVSDTVEEESHWRLDGDHPRPERYRYHRFGGKKERRVELRFDWQAGQVVNDISGDRWTMEIPAGTLDKLVYQVAIMLDLERGLRAMSYAIADGGTLKHYHLEVTGEETLETPLGPLRTLRIERTKESSKRTTRLWCAPRFHFLPVRIEQVKQDGETLRMTIERVLGMGNA
ncbi:DUF3108 domain-containing protein [Endothiovibrio diazotrophicus]